MTIGLQEAMSIVEYLDASEMDAKEFSFGENRCKSLSLISDIITSINQHSFYGRNPSIQGGVIVCSSPFIAIAVTVTPLLLMLVSAPHPPTTSYSNRRTLCAQNLTHELITRSTSTPLPSDYPDLSFTSLLEQRSIKQP